MKTKKLITLFGIILMIIFIPSLNVDFLSDSVSTKDGAWLLGLLILIAEILVLIIIDLILVMIYNWVYDKNLDGPYVFNRFNSWLEKEPSDFKNNDVKNFKNPFKNLKFKNPILRYFY